MKIGLGINYAGGFKEVVAEVADLEKAGLDVVFVPEAYSFDAISALGYLAAATERVELASGVLQLYTRTPTLTAMTAAGLDYVSDGRYILGLGASGPQVIEGFHGLPYDNPIGRTREVVEICRQVWRRERLAYQGKHYTIPLPEGQGTGLGKSLKLINHPVRERIPVLLAALGPKNVELAAEIGGKLSPDAVARNAGELRRLLAQFAGRLNIHARMENEALYPRLFEHRDAHVRDQAEALFSEVGSVYDAFGALLKEWPSAAEMAERPADFIRQTLKVFRLLGKRMVREENELYPLVDTLE